MTSPEDRLRRPIFGKRDVISHLNPLWLAKHWTKETAEKRIEGFRFQGIGWYVSHEYTLLVLPTANAHLYHFYVFQHFEFSTIEVCKMLSELPTWGWSTINVHSQAPKPVMITANLSIVDERPPAFACPHCHKEIDAIELRRFLQRQQYEERRALGQCTRCKKKAMPGKTMCKEHLARNNKLSRKANTKKANAKKRH